MWIETPKTISVVKYLYAFIFIRLSAAVIESIKLWQLPQHCVKPLKQDFSTSVKLHHYAQRILKFDITEDTSMVHSVICDKEVYSNKDCSASA